VIDVGFEVFRFDEGKVVERWDNLQAKPNRPNPSGHTMLEGTTEATDLDRTGGNRELIRSFVGEVLVGGQLSRLEHYIHSEDYVEHNVI
jgi:predicted SnoaL-like aldol condensation-catalyzing enzyme